MDNLEGPFPTNFKNVSVKISDGSMIKGKMNIGENYHRLSDLFRHSDEPFIIVVSEEPSDGSKKVFFINKTYIIWAGAED
jgi:hypothetical protein